MQDKIGKDLERFFEMFGGRFCIIAGRIFGGESVGLRPDAIHRVGDLKRVSFRRPLEHHVFDKMGDAVFLFRFEAGARPHEQAHAYGKQAIDLLYDEPQPTRKFFAVNFIHSSSFSNRKYIFELLPLRDPRDIDGHRDGFEIVFQIKL